MSLNWEEKKDLELKRTEAIEEYWRIIDPAEGSIVASNPLIQELVELCRASDAFVVAAFKTENWEAAGDELDEELLLAEVNFYQRFVAFAKKLENDRARVMGEIGSIKTEKKAKSSAENGKKGGRPRKLLEPEREEQLGFTGAEGLFSEPPRKSPAN